MALRQIPRTACRHLHRPTLSLLAIYTSPSQSTAQLPPAFLLPSFKPHAFKQTPAQRRHSSIKFPVAPALGPQFLDEVRVRYPYDDEITAREPSFIDDQGKLIGVMPIEQILRSYDRRRFHLIWLSDPDGLSEESEGHVVRLFSKDMLQEKLRKEIAESIKARKKERDPRNISKELQISWAIDFHDLSHRLGKVAKFLEKGNKVEIMIARKKGQAKQTQEKLDQMMEILKDFMYDYGGEPVVPMQGEVGTQIIMTVQRPENWVQPPPRPKPVPVSELELESEELPDKNKSDEEHIPEWQSRGEVQR